MAEPPADALADEAAALYALLPAEFVKARDARAKQLRADDKDLAAQVKALRRPTVAAWLVNLLAHEAGALDPLLELGAALREAQSRLDTATMKQLSAQRPGIVGDLADRAAGLAADRDPSFGDTATTREQVIATLTAALADPMAEQAVASGRLVSPLSYAGFGEVEIGDAIATPLRAVPDPADRTVAKPRSVAPQARTPSKPPRRTAPPAEPGSAAQPGSTTQPGSATDPDVTDTDDAPEPEPTGPSPAEIAAAEQKVAEAERRLEVAEASLAQARARRAEARRALEAATAALEDLQDA
ncbi:hypothetical protein FB554_2758 [Barrientosiimonas humi]|uniref:Uncharacterized protein n=1 Tax=Barrientosiimonas humi TaxID=999931 RepID=A0A542XFI5_9MICO|nr:hypothetical protein [Barrientosiimonas humi]TQL34582.1 hypothetical protein FB554_2758 [Barrientosiimonas humi]CAG7574572.1 hypothetical protein BH39T_PBIAJDOK_03228 [Barrientosiimonas humi]